jgi:secreted trypsin-like serine protease
MENEFPFIAALTRRVRTFIPERDTICTASLISKMDILTAEHCLEGESLNGFRIVVGSIDIFSHLKYYAAWWLNYDQWAEAKSIVSRNYRNDISIIRVNYF